MSDKGEYNKFVKEQKKKASAQGVDYCPAKAGRKIGISKTFNPSVMPINGLRHPQTRTTTGWYIWTGEYLSDAPDFFKPLHVEHLVRIYPSIIKYLGLPPGYRFLVDNKGYEDIWYDEKLLEV
jgi:hypothetical protein